MRIYAMPKPQPQAPKPQKVSEPFSTLELEAFPCAKAAAAGKPDADRFEAAAARGLAALCHCFLRSVLFVGAISGRVGFGCGSLGFH